MGIYIPNMDAKSFDELCKEKGLQFIYTAVPPHGRVIDADEIKEKCGENAIYADDVYWYMDNAPTIIPAEVEEENSQREYEMAVEAAQYCELYEPTYDPETGAL